MIDFKRLIIKVFIALTFVVAVPFTIEAKTFKEWFCGLVGIDPKVYDKLTRARGLDDPTPGVRLMKLYLRTGQEQLLWNCKGCWSPVMTKRREIAVLKKDPTGRDEIWIVRKAPKEPSQVFAGQGIDMLVGEVKNKPDHLLLLQKNAACKQSKLGQYSIRMIDLGSASPKLEEPGDLPQQCVSLSDVTKPDQIRNNEMVSNSAKTGPNGAQRRELNKAHMPPDDSDLLLAPLAPQFDALQPISERYDPIWFSDNEVVYILNPWPSP